MYEIDCNEACTVKYYGVPFVSKLHFSRDLVNNALYIINNPTDLLNNGFYIK